MAVLLTSAAHRTSQNISGAFRASLLKWGVNRASRKAGEPVDSHFSTVDATPIWPLAAPIFKDAPHPAAAKLFMSFLLDPEQQATTGTWPPRTDVPPPAGYKPIFSYLVANDYKDFLTNEAQIVELRKRFETYTGPIVNVGGIR